MKMVCPTKAGQVFLLPCWCFEYDPPNTKPDRVILIAEDTQYGRATKVIVLEGLVRKCGPGSVTELSLRSLHLQKIG